MRTHRRRLVFIALVLSASIPAFAQDDEDYPPGLYATYAVGDATVARVDPEVAFDWNQASPDPRIPAGPFTAKWTGRLLLRDKTDYRFHAHLEGAVKIQVDGETVLEGAADKPRWVSGPEVALSFGEKDLSVSYRKTGKNASVRLFWSSGAFRLEPLPAQLMFRDGGNPELAKIERGQVAFDTHRCNRCHQRTGTEQSPAAPALNRVKGGLNLAQLVAKIQNPAKDSPHSRMPSFGFDAAESEAVAAFLLNASDFAKLSKASRSNDAKKDAREGEILFRSLGCLACHKVGELGSNDPYGGGDLSHVGSKRSVDWLYTWLKNPDRLNVDHRMPLFQLNNDEYRNLALYLASLHSANNGETSDVAASPDKLDPRAVEHGRRLVRDARCVNCHRIDGVKAEAATLGDLTHPREDWAKTCLAKEPDRTKCRPAYPHADREALAAYLNSFTGKLAPASEFDVGKQVLARRNCLACHERGAEKGNRAIAGETAQIDEALKRDSEGMIPPALSAVGDKLHDAALSEAVAGEQKTRRLHWLHVRMPRFNHTKEEKAALVAHLIAADRIPAGAPETGPLDPPDKSEALLVGHTLVGPRGFSCIACHEIGDYKPKNVALGTRGSNLMMLGKRMREPYYLRWTRSPMRIVPGMEMPSYVKAVPGLAGEDVDAQLLTTWKALNDPRFTPPTNPSVVEQLLTVAPDDPPRIVRDVFTNPKANGGGYVPRAMAIGLSNGHSILYNLDTFTVQGWYFGDFARQRTEGKSWFWDMAGVPVMTGFTPVSDFALHPLRDAATAGRMKLIRPRMAHGTAGVLKSYLASSSGAEFSFQIEFILDGKLKTVTVDESIAALYSDDGSGWIRYISADNVPDGFALVVNRHDPPQSARIGSADVKATGPSAKKVLSDDAGSGSYVRLAASDQTKLASLAYFADLQRAETSVPPRQIDPRQPQIASLTAPARTAPPTPEPVTTVPGFDGVRLPLDRGIMSTAIMFDSDGTMLFTSLKGFVYRAVDSDGDGLRDKLEVIEEGLAAPFGLLVDGNDLIVAHKPELLRLKDYNVPGKSEFRTRAVVATGWGYNENYHDWTTGIVRDSKGNMYVGLGSDYAQKDRPKENSRWRGKVLRISPRGKITPVGHAFRYPVGLAIDADDNVYVSDNQGVQNTFNEINHLVEDKHYGVPSRYEENPDAAETPPAVQVPHPWSRSVNGLFFLPENGSGASHPFAGHGVGCEYDSRFLVRFTTQEVDGVMQGAVYHFSRPNQGAGGKNFIGPLVGAVDQKGDIYIGSIFDSGWLGGRNTGAITRLRSNGKLPNGIRELRATSDGFEIQFVDKVDAELAVKPSSYTISGYRRIWKGGYATPDSDRHKGVVKSAAVSTDGRTVTLVVEGLRKGYVYEATCAAIGASGDKALFPATGHYTLHRRPGRE